MESGFSPFRASELKRLMKGPCWPEAASKQVGYGDHELERAEAGGLLIRTPDGFVLTPKGASEAKRMVHHELS